MVAATFVAAAALGLSSCSSSDDETWGSAPGSNTRAGDVLLRYVHLEDPEDTDLYPEGADVPLYAWLQNEGDEPVSLVSVTAELSEEVTMTDGALPLELPPGEQVELWPTDTHLVLQDISRLIRGQDLIDVTFTFSDGTSAELAVEGVEVDTAETDM